MLCCLSVCVRPVRPASLYDSWNRLQPHCDPKIGRVEENK